MRGTAHRILPLEEALSLTSEELLEARRNGWYPPIAGAEHVEGAGGEGEGEGSGEGEGAAGSGSESEGGEGGESGEGSAEGSGGSGSGREEEGNHEDDVLELKRSEVERLKRIAREHDQAQKRREAEEKKTKERARKEQGQYEELLREKDEDIRTKEGERDEARYQLDAFKRRIRVNDAAQRLGFKDPGDAFRFLSDADTEDDTTTERALKRLAREKKYLVEERRSTGAPLNGDSTTLTLDKIKNMSEDEINANWDEVQKAMAAGI